jgi:murein DD-endopeptidase MepM/ murein hydrolase activator NlpD
VQRHALLVTALATLLGACVRTPPGRPGVDPVRPAREVRQERDERAVAEEAERGGARDSGRDAASTRVRAGSSDEEALRARGLVIPVAGVPPERIPDTFNAARSGARVHRATDILAPRGTPVLSADEGRVLRVSRNRFGGLVVYATDPDGRFVYYYAHLDRHADGIAEGTKLAKGDVIGYVGTTGNAPKDTPHLHFQVMRRERDKGYWEGTPLDARPFLVESGSPR